MKKASDKEKIRRLSQISQLNDEADRQILEAFEEEDRLIYGDEDEDEEYSYSDYTPHVPQYTPSKETEPEKKPQKHSFLMGFGIVVFLSCLIYVVIMLISYRQLHIVPLIVMAVTYIVIYIIDRKRR